MFEGTHNSSRTPEFIQGCVDFIVETSNSNQNVKNLSHHSECNTVM
jgi:hypothetical protein